MNQWKEDSFKESMKYFKIRDGKEFFVDEYQQKRDCYQELWKYVTEDHQEYQGKICALYGLRRTGKTVMMEQCLANMTSEEQEKSVYILCKEECDMLEIENVMDYLYERGKRYFFIDEVTLILDLQVYGNMFADYYRKKGAKIIIAGTDSFGIYLAKTSTLYDRTILIHTSQIPFAEFHRLCNKSLESYIEYGGTLTNKTYKNNQEAKEYLNTAIVENILHGLESWEEKRKHSTVLTELYERNELVSVIQRMINKFSYDITMRAIERLYKSAPLYATYQTLKTEYEKKINIKEVNYATKKALGIKDKSEMQTTVTSDDLECIKGYLELLDLFIKIPCFKSMKNGGAIKLEVLQQPGMIYAHATELLNQLYEDKVWSDECGIREREVFLQRADHFVKGILLENIILSETYRCYQELDKKRFYVSQLSIGLNEGMKESEADLIILDKEEKKTYLFEIKYSDKVVENQTRHLRNEEFLNYVDENFAPVEKCYVIYNGQPMRVGSIDYLNAEKFLQCIHEMYLSKCENLEKLFQQEEIQKNIKAALEMKEKSVKKPKEKKPKRPRI